MSFHKRAIALGVVFAFALSFVAPLATAQQSEQGSGSGLQLSPTRTDIVAQAGERKEFSITLRNITASDLTAQAVLNDFTSDDFSGTPKIIVDNNQRTPYTLDKILTGFQDLDIKAGETKEVKLELNVPGDVAPGAYFGALRYAAVPKGQAGGERQVALTASVAHLVLVEVPGDIRQQIQVTDLKARTGEKARSFFFSSPDQYALGIKNLGNGFSRPFGKVTVKSPFGKQIQQYDVNDTDPRGIVLPNSDRIFTNEANKVKMPGKYKLEASVAYGNGGEVVTYKSSFIYMPLWFIILLIVLLAAVAGGVYYIYRKKFSGKVDNRPKKKARKKRG